jgi:hypothetical protein
MTIWPHYNPNMEKTELNLEADCERCKGIGGREHFDKVMG